MGNCEMEKSRAKELLELYNKLIAGESRAEELIKKYDFGIELTAEEDSFMSGYADASLQLLFGLNLSSKEDIRDFEELLILKERFSETLNKIGV